MVDERRGGCNNDANRIPISYRPSTANEHAQLPPPTSPHRTQSYNNSSFYSIAKFDSRLLGPITVSDSEGGQFVPPVDRAKVFSPPSLLNDALPVPFVVFCAAVRTAGSANLHFDFRQSMLHLKGSQRTY